MNNLQFLILSGTGILPVGSLTGRMPVPQSDRLLNSHSLRFGVPENIGDRLLCCGFKRWVTGVGIEENRGLFDGFIFQPSDDSVGDSVVVKQKIGRASCRERVLMPV